MNRFAALLDALLFTPSRNGKLRLMQEYFGSQPDPERGWALAALTGELVFDAAKPSQVRALAAARVDPELLGWSYDFVGDLAETVSLIWPEAPDVQAPVPSLGEIVEKLKATSRNEVGSRGAASRSIASKRSGMAWHRLINHCSSGSRGAVRRRRPAICRPSAR